MHAVLIRPRDTEIEADFLDHEIPEMAGADRIRVGVPHGQVAQREPADIDEIQRGTRVTGHLFRTSARIVLVVAVPDAAVHGDVDVARREISIGQHKQADIVVSVIGESDDCARVSLNRRARIQLESIADFVSARRNDHRALAAIQRALNRCGVIRCAIADRARLFYIYLDRASLARLRGAGACDCRKGEQDC